MNSTAAPQLRSRRWLRRFFIAVLSVLLIAGVGVLADSLIAARVENKISQRIYTESNLPYPPKVQLAGFPYVAAAFTHKMEAVTVSANDLDVPGFGLVSVHASAQGITVPTKEVFSGDIQDAPTRKIFTRLQLDGVSLGNRMNIDDLQIQGLEDISPRGSWETEAIFHGTPEGFNKPSSVEVSLRIRAGDVYLTPTRVIEAPEDRSDDAKIVDGAELSNADSDAIKRAMTLKLTSEELPLDNPPSRVYVSGGSVYVEMERLFSTVTITDLTPEVRPLPEDEKPGL